MTLPVQDKYIIIINWENFSVCKRLVKVLDYTNTRELFERSGNM